MCSRVRFVAKTSRGKINPGGPGDGSPPAGSRGGAPVGGQAPQKPKDSKKNRQNFDVLEHKNRIKYIDYRHIYFSYFSQ